jgi:hypothetical protein
MTTRTQSTMSARNARAAQAELSARPATAPAYYLGKPATAWMAVFGRPRAARDRRVSRSLHRAA